MHNIMHNNLPQFSETILVFIYSSQILAVKNIGTFHSEQWNAMKCKIYLVWI